MVAQKKRYTVDDVMRWKPCGDYPRERIARLFGRRKWMTVERLVALNIPIEDKLWALLHEEVLPARSLYLLASRFAERELRRERKAGREPYWDEMMVAEIERLRSELSTTRSALELAYRGQK